MSVIRRKRGEVGFRSNDPFRLEVTYVPTDQIKVAATNARKHSEQQISQIALSISAFGFANPVLIDENNVLIGGHGRLAAGKLLGMDTIPAIRIPYLNRAQRRALAIADNKIAENATWDAEALAIELKALSIDYDLDLEITGFSTAELDLILDPASAHNDESDRLPEISESPVSASGDIWKLGTHRLIVGDIRDRFVLRRLMMRDKADMVFTDPPYNVRILGNVRGHGKVLHREFGVASGEMSPEEFEAFLTTTIRNIAAFSRDGSISYYCMDWRHIDQLMRVGKLIYSELKNLAVWVKTNGGLGSFLRSQHELVAIFKLGSSPHTNNFGLGQYGRYRTNVWNYAGSNSFGARRNQEINLHPTVKPVALVVDAIKDVTRRGDIVLDGFAGSGTTLIAAEKTGRICRAAEIDPLYADVIIRRWQELTGKTARHALSNQSFTKAARARRQLVEA